MAESSVFELASNKFKSEQESGVSAEEKVIDVIQKGEEILGYKVFIEHSPDESRMRWLLIAVDSKRQTLEQLKKQDSRLVGWPEGEQAMILEMTKTHFEDAGVPKAKKEYKLSKPDEDFFKKASELLSRGAEN